MQIQSVGSCDVGTKKTLTRTSSEKSVGSCDVGTKKTLTRTYQFIKLCDLPDGRCSCDWRWCCCWFWRGVFFVRALASSSLSENAFRPSQLLWPRWRRGSGKREGSGGALAERSKASDLSSDTLMSAWVRTPHLANIFFFAFSKSSWLYEIEYQYDPYFLPA